MTGSIENESRTAAPDPGVGRTARNGGAERRPSHLAAAGHHVPGSSTTRAVRGEVDEEHGDVLIRRDLTAGLDREPRQ